MSFYGTQVFFPKTAAWDNLQKSLKATFDATVWEHLAGTVSEPFALGERKRVAVKVIDERGNELLRVKAVPAHGVGSTRRPTLRSTGRATAGQPGPGGVSHYIVANRAKPSRGSAPVSSTNRRIRAFFAERFSS
jgi:hypothetical protein